MPNSLYSHMAINNPGASKASGCEFIPNK
jgi:hypothetical protein